MSTTQVQPYLIIAGRCEEAIEYYKTHLGAKVEMLMRFNEHPETDEECPTPDNWDNKVMHCSFRIGDSLLMASDGNGQDPPMAGIFMALSLPGVEEVNQAFAALSIGGEVQMPLDRTFWSPRFGMVTDQFGVGWMVMVADC